MDVHIDEAGRDDGACCIVDLDVDSGRFEMLADCGDETIANEDIADGIEVLRGVDNASAADKEVAHVDEAVRSFRAQDPPFLVGRGALGRKSAHAGTTSIAMTEVDAKAPAAQHERGFTLLEVMIAVAILSMMTIVLSTFAAPHSTTHPAMLVMQAALAEARDVAMITGDATNPLVPTGATISVKHDPLDPSGHGSVITIYRSRPIAYRGVGPGQNYTADTLVQDPGMPRQRVRADYHISSASLGTISTPFSILVSQSGFASIVKGYAYDPAHKMTIFVDPGCDESGVTISATDGAFTEKDPFACHDALLQFEKPHG
jgi:prepilin-type N-terminal cleavage/methylation domain-containing protein